MPPTTIILARSPTTTTKTTIDPTKGVVTPYGNATGAVSSDQSVVRFAVRYATASRWQTPQAVTSWYMPSNSNTSYPPACPQNDLDASQYSEDCLYMILYVPAKAIVNGTSVPTFMWIHGGSFNQGSASDAGLDGSALALATSSIVVTVQYRLGVLGWLPPSSSYSGNAGMNLGVRDVTAALTFLNTILPSFGGTKNAITIAGQSSGAFMIRALLAAPTAASQFKNAILQSDPMYFNFLPTAAFRTLQSSFYSSLPCTNPTSTSSCSLAQILSSQADLYNNAASIAPAAGASESLRPSVDGSFITTSLTGSSFSSTLKPLLITNVKDEAAPTIAYNFPYGTPSAYYEPALDATFGDNRTEVLIASPFYGPTALAAQTPTADQTRSELTLLGTDATWRCPTWSWARSWAGKGGNVWAGRWMVGATYPSNTGYDLCTESGAVCHQDDIYLVFGTTPSPTSAQTAMTTEIQARYSSFMRTSSPNPTSNTLGLGTWNAATTTNVHTLQLGAGGGEQPDGACIVTFWGQQVLYDWQIYGVN
ncbi:alpha/beta-hydrolase [Clavulina sp. PMI_390]|nr:alpha/beta-hydrolase [Clavulina sp. PMI_390]